uniref:Complement receptor type 2-like n=1 Tax=Callorhinchus milii TaxID=7868 RepID=A0A4W3GTK9_CALMI|eukprot:gi/632963235/ref/XP_007897767.1/ PREDICTED: complement receptor type 2-like isoform X2 [Callorhinchus milii]
MSERVTLSVLLICVIRIGAIRANQTGSCVDPPRLQNGYPSITDNQTTFAVNSRVLYRCNPGYIMPERSVPFVNCRADSTWSLFRFSCKGKSCDHPGEILNGYFSPVQFTFGNKIQYFCDPGFSLIGPMFRYCQVDGWSDRKPVCDPITCLEPPIIDHGKISSIIQQWEVGAVARYLCADSYSLIGEESIFCTKTGEWSAEAPKCKVVECLRPDSIPNGQVVSGYGSKHKYQDTVTYRCDEYFEMVGKSTIKCREDGTFEDVPACKPIPGCPQPKRISNFMVHMTLKRRYRYGESIGFTCHRGYRIVGQNPIVCKENGFFEEPPSCRLAQCDHPPELPGARIAYSYLRSFRIGHRTQYYCLYGYQRESSAPNYITCQDNLTWSEPLFKCVAKDCGFPEDIPNGTYVASSHSFGSIVTYTCDVGFVSFGRAVRRCTLQGWTGNLPICQRVRCPAPDQVQNGKIKTGFRPLYMYQDSIRYECDAGYQLFGSSVIKCTSNSTWDHQPPTCQRTTKEPSKNTEILTLLRQSIMEEENMITEERKLLAAEKAALEVLKEAFELIDIAC